MTLLSKKYSKHWGLKVLNNYIIKRMKLKNFKSIDEALIEFTGVNLNVLDGPNGFGKTTIYDAIQLLLTGSVRRIESNRIVTGNKGFQDHLFSKNQNLPTEITIEFINKLYPHESLVLQRVLMSPSLLSAIQKKPQDFSQYKLYILPEFEVESEKKEISVDELNELFGIKDMSERFNLYHYIEQEESTHLFKKSEKDRLNVITKLFNIEEETDQKQFLERVKNKLTKYKGSLEREQGKLENELQKETNSEISKVTYKPLISYEKVLNIPWDKENISPLDQKLKQKYLEELSKIEELISNKEDFRKGLFNEQLENVIKNEKKLEAIVVLGHFNIDLEKIKKQRQNQEKFASILEVLKNKEIIEKNIDWKYVFENLDIPFEQEVVEEKLKQIKIYKENCDTISSVVTQILQTREKLEKDFITYIDANPEMSIECPLCGDSKEDLSVLIEQMQEKTLKLKATLDTNSKAFNDEIEVLYNYINVIIDKIQKWTLNNSVDESFYLQLIKYEEFVDILSKAKDWFNEKNIDLNKYINREMKFVDNLDDRIQSLQEEIRRKKHTLSEYLMENLDELKILFRERFNNEDGLIDQITLESIKEKKEYIEYQYLFQTSLTFQRVNKFKEKLEKVNSALSSLSRLVSLYNDKINKFRAKMINNVEIPFYIYSGKIIQNHQRGIGVFIKEDKETEASGEVILKSLNFVPPVQTDHDIIHSFSSGQLSSTVIAFTLALNKVYGNSGIMTLLIDDPIQTMDEMNMASFVELLRNDFTDRQLIVSTHEDDISLYLRYKFLKYGLSVGNINVKQALYSR